ncbi:MAG: hypothetical protein AAF960_14740 [Bacteroidota bacterium]
MSKLLKNCTYLTFLLATLFACNPAEPVALSAQNTGFEANFKGSGTGFYTIDSKTGQLSFMVNYGEQAGQWLRYGNRFRENGTSTLHFKAIERGANIGTSFYILDGGTGQLSFMLDYGPGAGTWAGFGNRLRNVAVTEFEANFTEAGMIFYVYDGHAKQMHFMQDFGPKAGAWQQYGEDKN